MATTSSHKAVYWLIGIILLAVVGFGGYKLWHHYNVGGVMRSNTTATNQSATSPSPQTTGSTGNSGLPNKTDTSNQQLDQDLQNVQNSMNQLQQDQGTANNDTNNASQDTPQQY